MSPSFPVIEKSVFEYDDDATPAQQLSFSLASKLHIRNLSTGSKKDAVMQQPKRQRMHRSASEVIKCVFGMGSKA